jgi:hypothetical protein
MEERGNVNPLPAFKAVHARENLHCLQPGEPPNLNTLMKNLIKLYFHQPTSQLLITSDISIPSPSHTQTVTTNAKSLPSTAHIFA